MKFLNIYLTATLALCVVSGCSTQPSPSANNQGLQEISSIRLPKVGGGQTSLSDYRGKIVMLHFLSSWCGECGMEAPSLRNLYMSFKDSKFQILGVAIDDDPFETQVFISKYNLPFPVITDTDGDFKDFFQVKELPMTLFIGKDGVPIRFQDPLTGNSTAFLTGGRMWDTVKPTEMIAALVDHH